MLFNSFEFILVFLPLTLGAFLLLRRQQHRLLLVVGASYLFYAAEAWWFPALMVTTTTISFVCGRLIECAPSDRARRRTLAAGIVGVLALLGWFKYAGWLAGSVSSLLETITAPGLPALERLTSDILLPAGISFFTFEAISYMVDVYRRTIPAERNPLRYAYFISFFPHLIAGPIVRYGKLGPQLKRTYRLDPELLRSGLLLFAIGLAKKVLVADTIALQIDPLLEDPSGLGLIDSWLLMIGYALQIYFDFSGYSDMAVGMARMFGVELPWNFDRPYRAANPSDFWRRWHVTLSTWLRDYVYIPLGGNRRGPLRRDLNLLLTMGIGGLWHGAALTFVIWGLWHGMLLVAHHHLKRLPLRLGRPAAVALTFALVTIGWVFFRMPTLAEAGDVLAAMAGLNGLGTPLASLAAVLVVAGALAWGLPEEWRWRMETWGPRRVAGAAAVSVLALLSVNAAQKFLYFQF